MSFCRYVWKFCRFSSTAARYFPDFFFSISCEKGGTRVEFLLAGFEIGLARRRHVFEQLIHELVSASCGIMCVVVNVGVWVFVLFFIFFTRGPRLWSWPFNLLFSISAMPISMWGHHSVHIEFHCLAHNTTTHFFSVGGCSGSSTWRKIWSH